MGIREFVVDRWSALSHKSPMGTGVKERVNAAVNGWAPSSWVGEQHSRRLSAYIVLAAYDEQVSREFISGTDEDRDERREYGDAGLVIDTIHAALLGETQDINVPGSEDYDPDLGPVPSAPAEGEEAEDGPTPEEVSDNDAARVLANRKEWLDDWAKRIHFTLRLSDCERKAVGVGDGCWLLGWDSDREIVVPAVMDPGFYFPVLPDTLDSYDFPERIHFAWEIPGEDFDDGKERVRRITYEIVDIAPVVDYPALEASTTEEEYEAAFSLPEGVTEREVPLDPDDPDMGTVTVYERTYPWDTEPSSKMCIVTDAVWKLDDLNDASNVDAFKVENAVYSRDDDGRQIDKVDLGIDFLPIVHIPNTPPGGEHFGQSSLSRVLQVLDDLSSADTDAQRASSTTGSPIIGVSGTATAGSDPLTGVRGKPLIVKGGEVWRLGTDGRVDTVDTSGNLAATRAYVDSLAKRLLRNSRIPGTLVGASDDATEVSSGFHLQLTFGPLSAMVRNMRLTRSVKYPLMFKMVQRIAQANGALDDGPTIDATLAFGSFLPADMAGTLEMVSTAYAAKLISLETAVTMLLEVGFPIDDIAEEIARIQKRDYEGANALADATNDQDAVRDYLGLPPAPEAEAIEQPGLIDPLAGGTGTGAPSPSDSGGA